MNRDMLQGAEGVFSYTVDLTLWLTVYVSDMLVPQSRYGQVWRAKIAADKFLQEVNYEAIKHALATARKQKLIKKSARGAPPEITAKGLERLTATLPQYDEKRIWDGRLHLVTYDIPESKKTQREMFRRYLRRIGCGMLQDSVWMTPYNPIDTLKAFIDSHGLSGTVIISDLGKDASIGEEDMISLLARVYELEELNVRYETWLKGTKKRGAIDIRSVLTYLSILKDDPQLPFILLPSWWKGDEAFKKVKSKLL